MKRILEITGEIKKTNSSFGNWAIPCKVEYTYMNGMKRVFDDFHYTWTKKFAQDVVENYQYIKFES